MPEKSAVLVNIRLMDAEEDDGLNTRNVLSSLVRSDGLTVAGWTRHIVEEVGSWLPRLHSRAQAEMKQGSGAVCLNYGAGMQTTIVVTGGAGVAPSVSRSLCVGLTLTGTAVDASEVPNCGVMDPFADFWETVNAVGASAPVVVWVRSDSGVSWPHLKVGAGTNFRTVKISEPGSDKASSLLIHDSTVTSTKKTRKPSAKKAPPITKSATKKRAASPTMPREDEAREGDSHPTRPSKKKRRAKKEPLNEEGFTLEEEQTLMLAFYELFEADEPLNRYRFTAYQERCLIDWFHALMVPDGEPVKPMLIKAKRKPRRKKTEVVASPKPAAAPTPTTTSGKKKRKKTSSAAETPKTAAASTESSKKKRKKTSEGWGVAKAPKSPTRSSRKKTKEAKTPSGETETTPSPDAATGQAVVTPKRKKKGTKDKK